MGVYEGRTAVGVDGGVNFLKSAPTTPRNSEGLGFLAIDARHRAATVEKVFHRFGNRGGRVFLVVLRGE